MRGLSDFYLSSTRTLFASTALLLVLYNVTFGQDANIAPPGGYVRDRRLSEALSTLQRLEKAGSGQDFANIAQWMLDQPRDSIVLDNQGRAVSVRQTVERILSNAPRDRLADYRRISGPVANADLADARRDDTERGLWTVIRRYFLTEAGGQAAVELIVRGLDSGTDEVVTALGSRLLREPVHASLLTPVLRRRLELAADRVVRSSENLPISPAENVLSAAVMRHPKWSIPLEVRQHSQAVDARWRFWQNQLRDNEQSTAIAAKPLVIGDLVLFRDGSRLRAIQAQTGKQVREFKTNLGWESLLGTSFSTADAEAVVNRRAPLLVDWLVSNSTYFTLTTNGRQVFLVDGAGAALEAIMRDQAVRDMSEEQRREALANDVVAISLDAEPEPNEETPKWSLRARTGGDNGPFRGHTFLGPPAVMHGLLVVLTEVDREVCAAAIDPLTGEVRWIQPVAEPDLTILDDRGRFARSCTPTIARGLVLCPTQLGSLVALDVTTGAFVWVHGHYDPRPAVSRPSAFRPMAALPQTRNAAFNVRPWVSGSRVLYLAGQSDSVYCLDLETGRTQWSLSQPDADAIATITETAVVLLGKTTLRALSVENGAELWSVRLPAPPSGEAVVYRGELVVPLSQGSLQRVRLGDGLVLSSSIGHERHPTGHLAATRQGVVALGAEGLSAYQFAGVVRQELAKTGARTLANPAEQFQFAEVALAEGQLDDAVKHLETVRQLDSRNWSERTDPLLREAYFSLMRSDTNRREEWLERLRPLCESGEHLSRWLITRGEMELDQGRDDELVATFQGLAGRPGTGLHEIAADPGLSVSSVGWMRRTLRNLSVPQTRDRITAALTTTGNRLAIARSAEVLFPQRPSGTSARPVLARNAIERGQFHAAEVWLLRNAEAAEPEIAGPAVRQLAELYGDTGMANAAAVQWDRLATEFADVDCDGVTGRRFVEQHRSGGPAAAAYRRQSPVTWRINRAQIDAERRAPTAMESTERVGNPQRELIFQSERYARWRKQPREESDFEWTQRVEGPESYLLAWDRYAQYPRFQVLIPQGTIPYMPGLDRPIFERAIPIGSPAHMRMISVMQPASDGDAWTQTLPEWEDRSAVPMIGPGTLRLQLFQLRSTLVAVDPADGQVLWRRNDLEPNSGLFDRTMGLFADDNVVGVLGADRVSYRLLDAATGDVLRHGKLEADRSMLRYAAGTRLIWVVDGSDGKRGRVLIWDAAEDRVIFEETVRERQYLTLSQERELIWLNAEDQVCVLDVKRNQMVVRCPLDSTEAAKISSFRVFRQNGRYFINLGRTLATARTEHYHNALNDHALPVTQLRDDLLAIDPSGSSIAWKRTVPQSSIVSWGRLPVPVLVSMSKVRHKADNNNEWLRVDVHDIETGQRLSVGDQLPKDRWVHADYDGEHGEIGIYGLQNTVRVRFGKAMQQIPSDDDIL